MYRYKTKNKTVQDALRQYWQKYGQYHSDERIDDVILYNPSHHGKKRPNTIDVFQDYTDVLKTERGSFLILEPSPLRNMFIHGDTVFINYCSKGFPYMSFYSDKEQCQRDPIPLRKAVGKDDDDTLLFAIFRYPSFNSDWAEKEDIVVLIPDHKLRNNCMCVEYPRTKNIRSAQYFPIFTISKAFHVINHPDFRILT